MDRPLVQWPSTFTMTVHFDNLNLQPIQVTFPVQHCIVSSISSGSVWKIRLSWEYKSLKYLSKVDAFEAPIGPEFSVFDYWFINYDLSSFFCFKIASTQSSKMILAQKLKKIYFQQFLSEVISKLFSQDKIKRKFLVVSKDLIFSFQLHVNVSKLRACV